MMYDAWDKKKHLFCIQADSDKEAEKKAKQKLIKNWGEELAKECDLHVFKSDGGRIL